MENGLPPRVGPYEPIELLAEGGMARVVVARRCGLAGFERRVALKLILPELAADEAYTTMFLDEARMASRIQHPNVVAVLDVGRDEHTEILYMAMDLVLGSTLSAIRRANPAGIPPQAALEILAQAADGLDAAHCATAADGTPLALVHRDICPQNLLLGFDGFVRVSDFGIARAEQRSTKTESGKFKGKLGYCSPEHVLAKEVDHRSDLFALAILAWELLCGIRLFFGRTPSETLQKILRDPIPSLADARPELPAEATAVLDACLSREVDGRPSRAAELASALRGAASGAGYPAAVDTIRELVRHAATDQAVRLAGMDERRQPSGPPPPQDDDDHDTDPSTSIERPSRDTLIDFVPPTDDG